MYILSIYFENASENGTGEFTFSGNNGTIPKWTVFVQDNRKRELLQLMALALSGSRFLTHLPFSLQKLRRTSSSYLQLEFILAPHPWDSEFKSSRLLGSGIRIDGVDSIKRLTKKDIHFLPSSTSTRQLGHGTGNTPYFLLAYGPELHAHEKTDDFSFTDPFFRVTRFHSLFSRNALITDPVAFLTRLHYKGVRVSRYPAIQTLQSFVELFRDHLGIETASWMNRTCDFEQEWSRLCAWQRKALLPILDAARHLIDAFPRSGTPLEMPGLLLLDRPDCLCANGIFPCWTTLLDLLLPKMQIALTAPEDSLCSIPQELLKKQLPLPAVQKQRKVERIVRIPPKSLLLIDVDSRLPNLALMKISRYFKEQGRKVILTRKDSFVKNAEEVYASCVFSSFSSQSRIKRLRRHYGESLILGGSGVDISKRLPHEMEELPADYTLYPELKDRAIGFITRGCPFDCPFCIVPTKEGKTRQVSDLDSLLKIGCRKLILLDDNILSHPMATDFLEQMVRGNLQVNFTQTLDLRLLDRERARMLKRVHSSNLNFTRRVYHFSLNDNRNLDQVRRKYNMLNFTSRDNVEFICMYGYNTTLAEDVDRFSFLRSLPGAYVFVQEYQRIPGGPEPDLIGLFDDKADELIDKLTTIVFPQNMKSMEKYYRWLSKQYALTFGKLHMGLVNTIFRYNYRDRKGLYISTMAGAYSGEKLPPIPF